MPDGGGLGFSAVLGVERPSPSDGHKSFRCGLSATVYLHSPGSMFQSLVSTASRRRGVFASLALMLERARRCARAAGRRLAEVGISAPRRTVWQRAFGPSPKAELPVCHATGRGSTPDGLQQLVGPTVVVTEILCEDCRDE